MVLSADICQPKAGKNHNIEMGIETVDKLKTQFYWKHSGATLEQRTFNVSI